MKESEIDMQIKRITEQSRDSYETTYNIIYGILCNIENTDELYLLYQGTEFLRTKNVQKMNKIEKTSYKEKLKSFRYNRKDGTLLTKENLERLEEQCKEVIKYEKGPRKEEYQTILEFIYKYTGLKIRLKEDIRKADAILHEEEFRYVQEVIDEQYERIKYAKEILNFIEPK